MVDGIAAGDGDALTRFGDHFNELGLAEQLVGHIMYLVILTLPEVTQARLLDGGAKVIPFSRPSRSGQPVSPGVIHTARDR
jgi:hypothetical protein